MSGSPRTLKWSGSRPVRGLGGSVSQRAAQPADADADLASMLDRAERAHDRIVLTGSRGTDPWIGYCLREVDLVIAVSSGTPTPVWLDQRGAARM